MLKVKGKPILTPILDIMTELKIELGLKGIEKFHTIRQGPSDIQISCPFHKNGQERKPSCGITTVDKKVGERLIPAGTVHCFTCGESMFITEMISYCFGQFNDLGRFGSNWIVKNFLSVTVENRKDLKQHIS